MAEIVIRIHSKTGRSRINLPSNATLRTLQDTIVERLHVPINKQILIKEKGGPLKGQPHQLLSALGISNGSILNLDAEAEIAAVPVSKQMSMPLPELSPQKSSEKEAKKTPEDEYIRPCRHGPRERCINCLAREDAKRKEEGKDNEPQKEDRTWLCQHGPGVQCLNCLQDNFVAGIKHESFGHFMAVKRSKCEHSHDAKCPNCLPPAETSYKIKEDCNKHPPWPASICNSCMPATAVLARQPYRHVDYVQLMNSTEMNSFVSYWQNKGMQQRGGLLYGYYAEDPNYPDGVRAVVETIYEPPQIGDMNGFQFLDDPDEVYADMIAEALGLEKIGWLFTSINHDEFLSSHEIKKAAEFQQQHIVEDPSGYKVSKFVTVVLKPTDDGSLTPHAYMVSDQGQALVRDNVLGDSDSRRHLIKRQPIDRELLPTILCENRPVEEFPPDWLIVSLACGSPINPMRILHNTDFPIENRDRDITPSDMKSYLNKHKNEPWFRRCSNFHFLLQVAKYLDPDSALAAADAVSKERDIPRGLQDLLNSIQ